MGMFPKLQDTIHKMILYDSKKPYFALYSIVVFISALMIFMVVYTSQDSNEIVSFVFFLLTLVILDFWLHSRWWEITTILYAIFLICQILVIFIANKMFRSTEKSFVNILDYFFFQMCSWTAGPTLLFSLFRRYYIEAVKMKNRDHL